MKRLLIISDSPALYSGMARVVRELAPRFQRDYEVIVGGWFHALAEPRKFPYKIFPIEKGNQEQENTLINAIKPDIVLAIGDPWDFVGLIKLKFAFKFKLVGYLNIESHKPIPELERIFDGFDVLTTTSEFGARVIDRPGVIGIHHGVNMETFYPIPEMKSEIGSLQNAMTVSGVISTQPLEDTFVVLLNAQNTGRKNLATAIKAFAIFAKGKDDTLLYANTAMTPPPGKDPGLDLRRVIVGYGCEDKVVFNPEQNRPGGPQAQLRAMPDEDMNGLYAISDALLVTSVAEGFCLPVLEAMATKTVPIAPKAYSMPELLGTERGIMAPVNSTWYGEWGEVCMVDAYSLSQILQAVYTAWHERTLDEIHNAGLAFALDHTWDSTAIKLMDKMAGPVMVKVADGQEIDPWLRAKVKRRFFANTIGVLKVGGLGDMLQATAVIRALKMKYPEAKIVVFANAHFDVFGEDVAEVIPVKELRQDILVRTLADSFDLFVDLRYVSKMFGAEETVYFKKNRYYYDAYIQSNERLLDLGNHTTRIMLENLGLEGDITPFFTKRAMTQVPEFQYYTVATGVGLFGSLKKYPGEWWEDLASMLEMRGELQINGGPHKLVQVGGGGDEQIELAYDCRGKSLAETATLIENSQGFIGVEGGMAHLATAVGKKAIVLFGPTSENLFGYPQNINLTESKCRPCWFSMPAWEQGKCARGDRVCRNFVKPRDVELLLRKGEL